MQHCCIMVAMLLKTSYIMDLYPYITPLHNRAKPFLNSTPLWDRVSLKPPLYYEAMPLLNSLYYGAMLLKTSCIMRLFLS